MIGERVDVFGSVVDLLDLLRGHEDGCFRDMKEILHLLDVHKELKERRQGMSVRRTWHGHHALRRAHLFVRTRKREPQLFDVRFYGSTYCGLLHVSFTYVSNVT